MYNYEKVRSIYIAYYITLRHVTYLPGKLPPRKQTRNQAATSTLFY